MNKVIRTKKIVNFCGGCNNEVHIRKFIEVDEGEDFRVAFERKNENSDDELFRRRRMMGFCACGNIFLLL